MSVPTLVCKNAIWRDIHTVGGSNVHQNIAPKIPRQLAGRPGGMFVSNHTPSVPAFARKNDNPQHLLKHTHTHFQLTE